MSNIKILLIAIGLLSINLSKAQKTRQFKAKNGVRFEYAVILPEGFTANKSYELAMVFTQIEKEHKGYESTLNDLGNGGKLENTILFIPKVPLGKPHWISHPIHHGLNDLMDELSGKYGKRDQRFHFIGHLFGGRVAQTYSGMSSQYVSSVAFINSQHWSITKQQYFNQILDLGFPVKVYAEEAQEALPIDVSKTTFRRVDSFEQGLQLFDQQHK